MIWNGAKNGGDWGGYGVVRYDGKIQRAHRVSFMLFKGEIKPGNVVRHKCDVPGCINPKHLIQGTHKQNVGDAIKRGRR